MLHFVTSNEGKAREATEYLDEPVQQLNYEYTEVQSEALEPIAARGARDAYEHVGEPVIVDDTGLFIDSLSGFPGPYTSYVLHTVGSKRVSQIVQKESEPSARFRSVIAYCDGKSIDSGVDTESNEYPVKTFEGVLEGRIVQPRGEQGFGFDPIFEHDGKTLAERSVEETNEISHRSQALERFAAWFSKRECN